MKYFPVIATLTAAFFSYDAFSGEIEKDLVECPSGDGKVIELKKDETVRLPPSPESTTHYIKIENVKPNSKVIIKESKRKAQLMADFSDLLSNLKEFVQKQCVVYTQSHKRTTVEIKAKVSDEESVTGTFVAGPAEHLYLSFDMPLDDVKQLSYDTDTSSVVEKEKPSAFYASLNWQIGDIFTDYDASRFYNNLSIKLMVAAGGSPDESMGLGLSYSFKYADIFVARVKTEADSDFDLDDTESTIVGISFPISKKLGWLD